MVIIAVANNNDGGVVLFDFQDERNHTKRNLEIISRWVFDDCSFSANCHSRVNLGMHDDGTGEV